MNTPGMIALMFAIITNGFVACAEEIRLRCDQISRGNFGDPTVLMSIDTSALSVQVEHRGEEADPFLHVGGSWINGRQQPLVRAADIDVYKRCIWQRTESVTVSKTDISVGVDEWSTAVCGNPPQRFHDRTVDWSIDRKSGIGKTSSGILYKCQRVEGNAF
jgi:hypothetical protein